MTLDRQKKKTVALVVLVVYWLILFLGTTLPSSSLPDTPSGDKINHFAGYAVLSFLLFTWFRLKDESGTADIKLLQKSFIIASVYGVLDEVHQLLIPGRFFEWYDILADINGAALGLAIAYIVLRTFPRLYR